MSNSPQPVYKEVRDAIKAQPGHPDAHVSGRFDTAVILRDERAESTGLEGMIFALFLLQFT